MSDLEEVVNTLSERVKQLEDQLALFRIVSTYGPAMDTGSGEQCGALWAEDGIYEFAVETDEGTDIHTAHGPAELKGMCEADFQQDLIRGGCAHIMAMPLLEVTGDTAVATGYSRVYRHGDDGYSVWRVSANRWEFTRQPDGWRVARRSNRLIDGDPGARQILRRGLGIDPGD
jgi:hypothetical protein